MFILYFYIIFMITQFIIKIIHYNKNKINTNDTDKINNNLFVDTSKIDIYKTIFWVIIFIYIIMLCIFVYYFLKDFNIKGFNNHIIIYLIFACMPFDLLIFCINRIYGTKFKDIVIAEIIKKNYKDLNYKPEDGITIDEYKLADFQPFMFFYSNDLMSGEFDGIPFKISRISSFCEKAKIFGKDYKRYDMFDGILATVDTNININNYLCLSIKERKHLKSKKIIKTNIKKFDETYIVYTDNKKTARKILNTKLTSKILDINNGIPLEMVFVKNYIYFRFFLNDKLDEINIFNAKRSMDKINYYIYQIDEIKKIIKEISNIYYDIEK